jgi:hypothetical protein
MNVTILDLDIKSVKDAGRVYILGKPGKPALVISEEKLPELVALIYRVRPQVVWDIVCEECPENLCYHTNEIERGHTQH